MADLLSLCLTIFLLLTPAILRFCELIRSTAAAAAAAHQHSQHNDSLSNSSFMHLPVGFNLSSFDQRPPEINQVKLSMYTRSLESGAFLPLLSSPAFNSSNSSQSRSAPGFSLGLYVTADGIFTYLAVCGGYMKFPSSPAPTQDYTLFEGFAVPVWFANLDHPVHWGNVSLVVVHPDHDSSSNHSWSTSPQLELRNGTQVVWHVSNVGTMEISDSGDFRIYAFMQSKVPVFRMPITDTLIEGQRLEVGMQLTSNKSTYFAKMEKGGLALYLNSYMGLQPPAAPFYWFFPFFVRDPDPKFANLTINELVYTSPYCSATNISQRPPYLHVSSTREGVTTILEPGSCRLLAQTYYEADVNVDVANTDWSFLRMENDGRLYLYGVISSSTSFQRALDVSYTYADYSDELPPSTFMQDVGTECNVPLACGPLAVCTPGAKTPCSSPNEHYFEPRDINDLTQGYKNRNPLPGCTTNPPASSRFVELNFTANIFLLIDGWPSSSFTADINACKRACSLSCSCHGVSYQLSTSCCFLITQEISLLNISNHSFMSWNYISHVNRSISADDYVTHLKVAPERNAFPVMALFGIIPSGVLVFFLLGLGGCYWQRRQRRLRQKEKEEEVLRDILPLLPTRFSFKELHEATKGFSKLLGAGGCGSVYAGILLDGRKVAVKVLEGVFQVGAPASQCKDFLAELATVGRTGHHNIVRLLGFCWQVSHRLLVYEYMERGSLDRWLFGVDNNNMPLDWEQRYNVVLGVARGLHYLHDDCEQPILHFDIKPQNILLNDSFVPKLADFGMSRLMQRDASSTMTGVRGTPGYIAPEWFSHGTVSKKSDIYSMGVVMLEIVAGRKVLDYGLMNNTSLEDVETEAWHLPSWVAKRWQQGSWMGLIDKRLHVCGFDEVQVRRLLQIALWCIHEDPSIRPQAATIVQWLESNVPIQEPPVSNAPICSALSPSFQSSAPSYSTSSLNM